MDNSSIKMKHQVNQALYESLKAGASQDDLGIIENKNNRLDMNGNNSVLNFSQPMQSQEVIKTVSVLTAK